MMWRRTASRSSRRVARRFDRLAPGYDRRWASYVEASVRETLRRVEIRPGDRVLDVGCGTGTLLEAIAERVPDARLVGIDLSPAMLARARRRLGKRVPLIVGEADRLPLHARSFDLVVSTSALHYWPNPAAGLAEMARVSKPRGRFVITDWCGDHPAIRFADLLLRVLEPAHHRAHGTAALERLLGEAGLVEIRVERYRVGPLWGLMTAKASVPGSPGDPVPRLTPCG